MCNYTAFRVYKRNIKMQEKEQEIRLFSIFETGRRICGPCAKSRRYYSNSGPTGIALKSRTVLSQIHVRGDHGGRGLAAQRSTGVYHMSQKKLQSDFPHG